MTVPSGNWRLSAIPKFLSSPETEPEYPSSDDSSVYKSCRSNISDDADIADLLTSSLGDELDPTYVPETESSVDRRSLPIDEIRVGNRSINPTRHTSERSPPETKEQIGIHCSQDEVLMENNQQDNKGAYQSCSYQFGAGEVDPKEFVHIPRSEYMEYALKPQVQSKVLDTRLPQDGVDIAGWNPMSSSRDQLNSYLREGLQNHLYQNEFSLFHHQPIPWIAPYPPSSSGGRGAHGQQSKEDIPRIAPYPPSSSGDDVPRIAPYPPSSSGGHGAHGQQSKDTA